MMFIETKLKILQLRSFSYEYLFWEAPKTNELYE